jgi:micrococcal nuclease
MYTYKAKVVRVVDGDTVYLEVDLGFHIKVTESFRLLEINAPELRTADGPPAREHLSALLDSKELTISTQKADSFGRWLCEIVLPDGTNVNQKMISDGFAVPYKK